MAYLYLDGELIELPDVKQLGNVEAGGPWRTSTGLQSDTKGCPGFRQGRRPLAWFDRTENPVMAGDIIAQQHDEIALAPRFSGVFSHGLDQGQRVPLS